MKTIVYTQQTLTKLTAILLALTTNLAFSAGSIAPSGPPAPTMKSLQEIEPRTLISSLPAMITQPGAYYLTANLTGVAGQNGITITASDVTLDLNGYALIGVPQSRNGIVAATLGGPLANLVVYHGAVRNWGEAGMDASVVFNGRFEKLHFRGNTQSGLRAGDGGLVQDCTAFENGVGIETAQGTVVTRCTSSRNRDDGMTAGPDNVISHSLCVGNGDDGIQAGAGTRILQCTATANSFGFYAPNSGVTIERSTTRTNLNTGIYLASSYCQVIGNVCDGNDVGILATGAGNRIEDNHTTQNRTLGIRVSRVGGRNVIVKNTARNNEGVTQPNDHNYEVAPGNLFGPVISFGTNPDPILANVYPQNHPWANYGDFPIIP